ncbi:uncharacterized protein LOC133777898 [Humulus lupulus]|uniref:uncharacterized protein LOC133777898 n=1 Tax=Humulus lupulus TaxID=3486 RepID=UPI002B411CF3|nr:uncharacterized protein LOC133777898 [Humulus lupulus]
MDCFVLPVTIFKSRCMGSRQSYQPLADETFGDQENQNSVIVVVGKEKREFLVDPFVLEENPFRVLIDTMNKDKNKRVRNDFFDLKKKKKRKVVFVDVDSILFEHMLWLMHNDCSSLFNLNLKEIIDFYSQDN